MIVISGGCGKNKGIREEMNKRVKRIRSKRIEREENKVKMNE